jgi:hypothetical protein
MAKRFVPVLCLDDRTAHVELERCITAEFRTPNGDSVFLFHLNLKAKLFRRSNHHHHFHGIYRAPDGFVFVAVSVSLLKKPRVSYLEIAREDLSEMLDICRADESTRALWISERQEGQAITARDEPDSMDEPLVPAVDVLMELRAAYQGFHNALSWTSDWTWAQEDDWLPIFARLADAVQRVRPHIGGCSGWPPIMDDCLRHLVECFDETTAAWGWEGVAKPEPARSAHIKARLEWFRNEIAGPMYDAAISWQRDDGIRCQVNDIANEGWSLGFRPSLPPGEGKSRYDEARHQWESTPRLGSNPPDRNAHPEARFVRAWNALGRAIGAVSPPPTPSPASQPTQPPESKQRGENAPPTPPRPDQPVILAGPDDAPIVRGKEKEVLTPGQYRVVKVLVEAFPERIRGELLARKSGTEDPVGMIDRLSRDKDWASVLSKPGKAHGGYGIVAIPRKAQKSRETRPRKPSG